MWRNTQDRYGALAVSLHWSIALLFLLQLALGYATQVTRAKPLLQFELFQWHKSFGFAVLALATVRVVVAIASSHPRPLPGLPRWQHAAARTSHAALLALTIAVPLAGWAVASTSTLRIPSYVFNLVVVPMLPLTPSPGAEAWWSSTHAVLAYATLALVVLHVGAAILHARRRHASVGLMLPR